MAECEYDLTEIARIVATRENIKDYKLKLHSSTNKGDGYTGSVRALTIVGSNKQLEIVVKYSHRDPRAHESVPLHEAYVSEIFFYEMVAPTFKQFQADHKIKEPFDNSAKYYGSIQTPLNECIAMENLKCLNYDLWDRTQEMNPAHLEFALRTFAKLHGTSMAMKHLNPKMFEQLASKFPTNMMYEFIKKAGVYKQLSDTILKYDKYGLDGNDIYAEKLEHYRVNMEEVMTQVFEYHDQYDAILQGDCWCNNALYHYDDLKDRSKPNNIKLLDWQIPQVGCVAHDLSYFFYSIAPKESIDNLDYFMKVYHDAMGQHLEAFGLNVDEAYPFNVFYDHWKKNALYGLLMGFIIRQIALVESSNAPDLGREGATFMGNITIPDEKRATYTEQMRNIIKHFVDRKFI